MPRRALRSSASPTTPKSASHHREGHAEAGRDLPDPALDPKAEKDYLSDSEVLPMSFYVDKTGKVVEVTAGLGSQGSA